MDKYKAFFSIIFIVFSCIQKTNINTYNTEGMVLIDGNTFMMGSDDSESNKDESPIHRVKINSFWIYSIRKYEHDTHFQLSFQKVLA